MNDSCHVSVCNLSQIINRTCVIVAKEDDIGTGTLISFKNHVFVLTNYHLIPSLSHCMIIRFKFFDKIEDTMTAEMNDVHYCDEDLDCAFIGIKNTEYLKSHNITPLDLDCILNVCVDQDLLCVHHQNAAQMRVSWGKIIHHNREEHFVVHSCPTEPGSSGSLLYASSNNKLYPVALHHARICNHFNPYKAVGEAIQLSSLMRFLDNILKVKNSDYNPDADDDDHCNDCDCHQPDDDLASFYGL